LACPVLEIRISFLVSKACSKFANYLNSNQA
jgi:hypothetical protein